MPASTPKYAIPYPLSSEPVADGDDAMRLIAERVDYLLGERVVVVVTVPSAGGTGTTNVPLTRVYSNTNYSVDVTMTGAPSGFTWVTPYPSTFTTSGMLCNVRAGVAGAYTIILSVRPA